MSYAANGTTPILDAWSGYVAYAQTQLTPWSSRMTILSIATIPVLVVVLNVLSQLLQFRKSSEPPVVFHWFPFIGSAIGYGTDPLNFFNRCRDKYGDVFTFVLFGRRVTVALGSKGNNFILGGKSIVFNAEDAYTHLTTPVFGKDVVYDIPNDLFMEQKKFVKVGLSSENLRAYVGMIEEEVEEYLGSDSAFSAFQSNDANEWGHFDVLKVMSGITILTASRTLQGKEVRAGLDKTFAEIFNDLDGGFTPLNFLFPNLPLASYKKRDIAHKKISDFFSSIVKGRRAETNPDHEYDMIASLMNQKYRDGRQLKDHEIAHIMIALLMAGQHTSSATGSWVLCHLARRPDVCDALYKEQVKNFSNPDGSFRSMTHEELRQLPILDSVIRETLRLHPPIHSVMRHVRDDMPVPATLAAPGKDTTYVIPKGHYVLASPLVSQLDRTIWKDAETWEPLRWSDPEGIAAQANKLYEDVQGEKIDYGFGAVSKGTESPYQPFGAGKHRCIGEQFAYLQLGTIITTFIRHMELKMDKLPEHNYQTLITLPKAPREVYYRRRK
ncbi:hypothetical protein AGABI1DRAFT_114898 [Agaricus bisporus var. burnettii JB137-S8]|uniref:Lanosterol 14-alpha-demethylase n=1 Tax=Agaricus bisporus var. burnettii (strain JB137-S8 / ATCC MYA-4627 / FGSC 10392) TaxID=597362 RepID=K5X4K6_AGABU|nr:uncharacterized protein AGABI1DRAFT_114898 [Agaricus bisporus var. burnettii JB137-S8]EKM78073.1 hypothetical protein AGABI1DRAFT_114898 [Agaricus bisporus var. burnettii JB137-S8]